MPKYFLPKSLIAAYSLSRKPRTVLYSALLLIFVLAVVLSFFVSSNAGKKLAPRPKALTANIGKDLEQNLQWLNRVVEQPKKMQSVAKNIHHNPTPQMHATQVTSSVLDAKRLAKDSLVFIDKQAFSSSSQEDRVKTLATGKRLMAGEVLHAVLESAIQSDFAGPVRAVLSEPAYAYRTTAVLLPVGTRLIGEYKNAVSAAQTRIGIRWQRLILPDGRSIRFDSPTIGPMGRVGVQSSYVDRHFWKRFGEAALYSLLSAGAQLSGGADASTLTAAQLLRSDVSSSFAETAMSALDKDKGIAPTIYLNPGSEISIFVRKDIVF